MSMSEWSVQPFTRTRAEQDYAFGVDEIVNRLGDGYGPGVVALVDVYRGDVWGGGHDAVSVWSADTEE